MTDDKSDLISKLAMEVEGISALIGEIIGKELKALPEPRGRLDQIGRSVQQHLESTFGPLTEDDLDGRRRLEWAKSRVETILLYAQTLELRPPA